jgi:hypothetical protein
LNLDGLAFATCLESEATASVLQDHFARLGDDFKGLPTTYVGSKVLIGARPEATFRDAFEHAQRSPVWSPSGGAYLGFVALGLVALVGLGRRRQQPRSEH